MESEQAEDMISGFSLRLSPGKTKEKKTSPLSMWMPQLGQVEKLSILPTCEAAKLQCCPFFDSSFVIEQRRTGIEGGVEQGETTDGKRNGGGKQTVGEP